MQSLDRLDIDTPEQISLELPLAGIGSRFLALTIDSLIQIGVLIVLTIVGAVVSMGYSQVSGAADHFFSETVGTIVLIVVPFCLYWGYFAFFEILWQGRTPGKRVAGIRVIHQTGRPMSATGWRWASACAGTTKSWPAPAWCCSPFRRSGAASPG